MAALPTGDFNVRKNVRPKWTEQIAAISLSNSVNPAAKPVTCSPQLPPNRIGVFAWFSVWLDGSEAMKASRFTDAQKIFILKRGECLAPVKLCHSSGSAMGVWHGSEAAFG